MSEITELNRKPDIDGDVISAVSVGADSATVGSLEAVSVGADSATVGSLEADSVTFNQDITDADNNTVTNLSDPVRVTQEASTFTESDVTVTKNNTSVSNGSVQLLLGASYPDDFEDGVDSGWSQDTSFLTAQSTTVLSGTQSGQIDVGGGESGQLYSRSLGQITSDLDMKLRIDTLTGGGDNFKVDAVDSGGTRILRTIFEGTGDIIENTTSTVIGSWNANTTYRLEYRFDFANDESDIYLNDSKLSTVGLENTASSWDQVRHFFNAAFTNTAFNILIDNVPFATSGDALIEWDSGVSTDIDSWDLATFQRTLDSETVTVDVEDSNGTVLKSDISKDTDISDIATTTDVQLRANLSRNDTSNNPTVDYLARRLIR